MKQVKNVKKIEKVGDLEKMTPEELNNEELYSQYIQLANRKHKIDDVKKNIAEVHKQKARDLKRLSMVMEEKKIIAEHGNDATTLNQLPAYRTLLSKMCNFEIDQMIEKSEDISGKVAVFEKEQSDNVEGFNGEIEVFSKRIDELEKLGAKLTRELPEGSFLDLKEE